MCVRAEIRGAGSVETTAGEEWVATAERHKSMPKATCVKANRTLDAVSDGAFAATRITALRVFVWVLAILIHTVSLQFQQMPLQRRSLHFDDSGWLFAIDSTGFTYMAVTD